MARAFRSLASVLWVPLTFVPCHAGDVIRLHNVANQQTAALVDGVKEQSAVNDARYNSLDMGAFLNALFPIIPLDSFVAIGNANEIIAFGQRRPPALVEDVPWTPGSNTIDVTFDDEYFIPVHVWIVQGPFDDVWSMAVEASLTTSLIWAEEGQGIAFESFVPHDATGNPGAGPFLDFTCAEDAASIMSVIGHVPDVVNVYYVNRVYSSLGTGVWCSGERIVAMGRNTSDHLLAHELGHGFSLGHTQTDPLHFDSTNVMYNSSSYRRYLTEGQTFRSVFDSRSAINAVYGLRAGEVMRDCNHDVFDLYCPGIFRRVWQDGPSWPPN